MWTRRALMAVMMTLGLAAAAQAQVIVTSGPPPELRKHMDAFMKALNTGTDEEWVKMVKENFTADFNKRNTPDSLKKIHADLKAKFGTVQIQNVQRNGGPDAPLQIIVKGTVASGSIWMDLDDDSFFDSIKGEVEKTLNEDCRH